MGSSTILHLKTFCLVNESLDETLPGALCSSLLPPASFSLVYPAEKGIFITDAIQLKIADAFMEEGEYYRAITEYKKLLILFPDSDQADYALFRIGMAYYQGEEYEPSVRSFSSLREKYSESTYLPKGFYFEGLGLLETEAI